MYLGQSDLKYRLFCVNKAFCRGLKEIAGHLTKLLKLLLNKRSLWMSNSRDKPKMYVYLKWFLKISSKKKVTRHTFQIARLDLQLILFLPWATSFIGVLEWVTRWFFEKVLLMSLLITTGPYYFIGYPRRNQPPIINKMVTQLQLM